MRTAPDLNAYPRPQWAAVVSGQVWKAHTLTADGALTVSTVRGPVVIWGQVSGEGEDVPRIHPPTPSPLEAQATRQNMVPHFLAFVRAARGKVRHSVRWKTGRRIRRLRGLEALERVAHVVCSIQRRLEGKPGFYLTGGKRPNTRRARKQAERDWRSEYIQERLQQIAPGVEEIIDHDGSIYYAGCVDDSLLIITRQLVYAIKKNRHFIERYSIEISIQSDDHRGKALLGDALFYALTVGDMEAVAGCLANLRARKRNKALDFLILLEAQQEAYRAHITRRVRPVSRRTRIPRPLYARPRPPTAPLAPPVI